MGVRRQGVLGSLGWAAALVVAATACSPVVPFTGGDGGTDGGGDSGPPFGLVKVTVLGSDNAPVPAADVVFHGPDGAVLRHVPADPNGKAEMDDFPAGGMITVGTYRMDGDYQDYRLNTVMAAKPGDDLVFGGSSYSYESLGSVTINLPAAAPPGTTRYWVTAGCSGTSASVAPNPQATLYLAKACLKGSTNKYDLVLLARNDLDENLGYIVMKDLDAPPEESTVTVTAPAGWLTAAADWATFNLNLNNAPPGATSLEAEVGLLTSASSSFDMSVEAESPIAGGGNLSLPFKFARNLGTGLEYNFNIRFGDPLNPSGEIAYIKRVMPLPTMATVDMGNTLLPVISAPMLTGAPTRPVVSWDARGADLGAMASGAQPYRNWMVGMPASTASPVTLPELPVAMAAYLPDGAVVANPPVVLFMKADFLQTYDDFRRTVGANLGDFLPPAGPFEAQITVAGQFN
jgi:hypothetical protein